MQFHQTSVKTVFLSGEDLIAPCHCKGTQKYVHRLCLDNWRSTKVSFPEFHITSLFLILNCSRYCRLCPVICHLNCSRYCRLCPVICHRQSHDFKMRLLGSSTLLLGMLRFPFQPMWDLPIHHPLGNPASLWHTAW